MKNIRIAIGFCLVFFSLLLNGFKGISENKRTGSSCDYSQTLVMKMFLSKVNDCVSSTVFCNLDQALDIIKTTDQITLGIPKIIYLVGWQYHGHDDKYPAFFEVNPALKRTDNKNAHASLLWLMKNAAKYHTTVSLHINMTDAYEDSPLWDEYVSNDLISKNADGSLMVVGHYNNKKAYQVNYKNEWEKGYAQKRIDKLIGLFPPLKNAGTIHIDAWISHESKGHHESVEVEREYQKKICEYWRGKGITPSSEWYMDYMNGLIPHYWHFNHFAQSDYLKYSASFVTGSSLNPDLKRSDFGLGFLFGKSMYGENLFPNSLNGKFDGSWVPAFVREFYLNCPQYFFLNTIHRESVDGSGNNRVAIYSAGVVVSLADSTVVQNGLTLRMKDTIFFPAVWLNDGSYVLFSKASGTKIVRPIPREWKLSGYISIFEITNLGLKKVDYLDLSKRNEVSIAFKSNCPLLIVPENKIN